MAAQKRQADQINLLPQLGFQASTAGRILAWILSTFRVIVIVTEIIVMIAFLSRFWFDAQNSDLNETLLHKQAVLSASADFEAKFKDVQHRLDVYSRLDKLVGGNTKSIETVKKSIPGDVILTDILSQTTDVRVTGITPNEKSIQQMIVNLASNPMFSEVNLVEAGTKLDDPNVFNFVIVAKKAIS